MPNKVHSSVPIGDTEKDNVIVREFGEKPKFNFDIKDHLEIGESLGILDMGRGSKISGAGFPLYIGLGAKLERSLISFMLDRHIDNGYIELFPSFLTTQDTTQVTGQLPKFKDDMYYIDKDDLYCISTAEVPVTSFHKDEVLKEADLPRKYAAYSACFRREAGSYGKDTKGMMRQHQFYKVELVSLVEPKKCNDELNRMLNCAEEILKLLELPYQIVLLSSGDMGFSAEKTFDIETWVPFENKFREISSCSSCGTFQARRMKTKYKSNTSTDFIGTLNGSGLATGRLMISLMENYQNSDGSITIPTALKKYLNNIEKI